MTSFSQDIGTHDFKENPAYDKLVWYDRKLIADLYKKKDAECFQFFRLLALCHTVMPDYDKDSMYMVLRYHRIYTNIMTKYIDSRDLLRI